MGRLNLGTIPGFREFTTLTIMKALDDDVLQAFIDRSEAFLDRHGPYNKVKGYKEDMAVAVYRLCEILWNKSSASLLQAISSSGIMQSERIGTYSYTRANVQTIVNHLEIDTELLDIITYYRKDPDFISVTSLVFKEVPYNTLTGQREYKDISDALFNYIQDNNIRSGDVRLRSIV